MVQAQRPAGKQPAGLIVAAGIDRGENKRGDTMTEERPAMVRLDGTAAPGGSGGTPSATGGERTTMVMAGRDAGVREALSEELSGRNGVDDRAPARALRVRGSDERMGQDSGNGLSLDTAPRAVTPAAVKPLLPGMRWVLYVAAVLVFLAGCQLFIFPGRTASYFAWTIHNPLAALFLGAGYWASVPFEALAARQRVWANARIAVPTVLVFTLLTLVATLTHLGTFHFGGQFAVSTRLVTWAWLAIYIVVPVLLLTGLVRQLRAPGVDPPRAAPLPGWLRALLGVQAVVMLGVGVALLVAPGMPHSWWPWTLTPLLVPATAAWLIGFGVAAAQEVAERDARRLVPASAGSVAFVVLQLIALALYPGRFEWSSAAGVGYLALLATMLITGAAGLALARPSPARQSGEPARGAR